ncbi:MAG: hypothetical protein WCQ53_08905, partial [bacterium]
GHAETQGLLGYAEGKGLVLSTKQEVLDFVGSVDKSEKICVVAQTTQEIDIFNDMCSTLSEKFNGIKIIDTICDATRNRQEEIRSKSKGCDRIFIVGGKDSANTTRLYEIAQKICPSTLHIERADEVETDKISANEKIFITAGASTPLWVAHEVRDELAKRSLLNMALQVTGSRYTYWIAALIAMLMSSIICPTQEKYNFSMLMLGGSLLASRGMIYYYLKRLDVFRLDYFYGHLAMVAGLALLAFLAVFFSYKVVFFLFYYCILFYVVYKNIAVSRDLFFTLCNLIFFTVPFMAL